MPDHNLLFRAPEPPPVAALGIGAGLALWSGYGPALLGRGAHPPATVAAPPPRPSPRPR
jgi:hypothetical protein